MGTSPKDRGTRYRKTAQRIISSLLPDHLRLPGTARPLHLKSLADELGVKRLLKRPLTGIQDQHPGVDAMLVPLPKGYSVVINENAPHARQRYSLAHELGHIMLLATDFPTMGPTRATRYRSSNSAAQDSKAEERLCDAIAAELLMPETVFTREVEESGRSLGHLPRLANVFDTSLTATAIRYWELLPEPCHLIRWRLQAQGVITPAWQMRNGVSGLSLHPVMPSSRARRNEFRAIRESWETLSNSRSQEDLLVVYPFAGRRYLRTMTFETESIVFGSRANRAAMSAVYLSRSLVPKLGAGSTNSRASSRPT